MATDPKARTMVVSYEGGSVAAAQGLLEFLFGAQQPEWGAGSIGTTQLGRKRYKYGSRQRSNAAGGEQVFLDCGEEGVFSVRVTGDVVDFIEKMLPGTGTRVKRAYTRRGSIYGPTLPNL
jgi:CO dehydrogenase/acetyl-CoA synthase delta subunit